MPKAKKESKSSPKAPPKPTPMEVLLGPELLTVVNGTPKPTKEVLGGKKLVGLYFSASWCQPCQNFTPLLIDVYNALNNGKYDECLEIVYLSSDKSMPEFERYYEKMPWASLPPDETAEIKLKVAKYFYIRGIPTLIILDAKTGNFITDCARDDVIRVHGKPSEELKQLMDTYMEKESVPIEEARTYLEQQKAGQSPGGIKGLLHLLKRNPMWIFALLYGYKWLVRQWKEYQQGKSNNMVEGEL